MNTTWQGLDGFQKCFALGKSILSIERVLEIVQ